MKTHIVMSLILSLSLFSVSAKAEQASKTKYTDEELIEILEGDGHESVSIIQEGALLTNGGGMIYAIHNRANGDIQTYFTLTTVEMSHKDVNEWNRTRVNSSAYLDDNGALVLESFLLARGGITQENISEFFRFFTDLTLVNLVQFLNSKNYL